jgi:hypothetical protein
MTVRRRKKSSMFVRKRASGNQLLESYRDPETGKPKQRVICNLGEHESPEEALEAARAELDELLREVHVAEARVAGLEAGIKEDYARPLEKWHGGEVPPLEVVLDKAREMVRHYGGYDGDLDYGYDGEESYIGNFATYDRFGPVQLEDFIWTLRELEDRRARARAARAAVKPKERKLRERIAVLERVLSVVSK